MKGNIPIKVCRYCFMCLPSAKHTCEFCGAPTEAYYKAVERKKAKRC